MLNKKINDMSLYSYTSIRKESKENLVKRLDMLIKKLEGKRLIMEDGLTSPIIKQASFTPKFIKIVFETKNNSGETTQYL